MLPPELYPICRNTLCRCQEFQSYRVLKAVFVTDHLFPFRIGLPQADTVDDLVDLCLDYLIGKRLNTGQPVFLIFIATLRDRYQPGDALRDDLEHLHNAILEAVSETAPQTKPSPRRRQVLFDRLLQLDFRPQVKLFREVVEEHRVAAFLIHGPPEHGQRMLAYRLTRLKPEWETGQHIVIDAGSNGAGKSSRALWGQVAKKLQLSSQTPLEELAAKVGQWLQTQDVIFTFDTVDYIPSTFLSGWIEEFWGPLVTVARQIQPYTSRQTHLLLFLIDYRGKVCQSDLTLAQNPVDLRVAPMPLPLPALSPFPELELEIWIDTAAEVLPTGLSAADLVGMPYNGIPELIYDKICAHCGFSWEGEIAR
jgi:hypothetical protein